MRLTDIVIRKTKPADKPYRLFDGGAVSKSPPPATSAGAGSTVLQAGKSACPLASTRT